MRPFYSVCHFDRASASGEIFARQWVLLVIANGEAVWQSVLHVIANIVDAWQSVFYIEKVNAYVLRLYSV